MAFMGSVLLNWATGMYFIVGGTVMPVLAFFEDIKDSQVSLFKSAIRQWKRKDKDKS